MRSTVAWLLVFGISACDLNSSPSEEAPEAQDAIEQGAETNRTMSTRRPTPRRSQGIGR